MNVVFFTHYTYLYGANRSLLDLIDGLQPFDIIPYVIAPGEGDLTQSLRQRGIAVSVCPFKWWLVPQSDRVGFFSKVRVWFSPVERLILNIWLLRKLKRQIESWSIDLIHSNSSAISIGAMVAKVTNLPHVWHLREFGDLDYQLKADFGKKVHKYIIGKADARIAVSESLLKYHREQYDPEFDFVIYNGVASVSRFNELRAIVDNKKYSREIFTFVLVGIVHINKGQEEAVRALALVAETSRRIRLLIVGRGNTDSLKNLACDLGVFDLVEFCGHLDDPYDAYLKSNAALMCSRWEAMGRVTVEAMSACLPVVGYDAGGTSELIEHGSTGLLYRGGSEELARCMLQLMEDKKMCDVISDKAWSVAREKYSIEGYAKNVYRVFESACDVYKGGKS